MSEHTMRSLLIDGARGAGLTLDQVQQATRDFDEMHTSAERGKLALPGWERLGEWVQVNAPALGGQLGERYADILLRALPVLMSQAHRYRFFRALVQIDPNSDEAGSLDEVMNRPDLQPPTGDQYTPQGFDSAYDALAAAASAVCPTIAAALNMEI